MTRQCVVLTRDMLHAVTTTHKKAMPNTTLEQIQTLCGLQWLKYSCFACPQHTIWDKWISLPHEQQELCTHCLTVMDRFLILIRERHAIAGTETSGWGSSTHWCIQALFVLLHASFLLSHERFQVEKELMSHCRVKPKASYRLHTCVQLSSLQLLQVEWQQQESTISYPPKVLKCIVATNIVMQLYNEEATDGYMDEQRA